MSWIRRLYDWVLHWAETPYAIPALIILAFTEASVFPIPPDALLLALALGTPKRSYSFAFLCTIGSVVGGLAGYLIGFQFWHLAQDFFFRYVFSVEFFEKVQVLYQNNAFLSIFISGFTPIPYKVFTVSAGVFELNLGTFTVASILGRGLRFFLVATMIFYFGAKIKKWINEYFEIFTIAFTVLLIGGFVLVKVVLH